MGWSCAKCESDPDECAACFRGKNMNRAGYHMNERIDVLAVMDEWPKGAWGSREEWGAHLMRHAEARAAVAELIEAVEFVRDNVKSDTPEMWARLDEALARVQGGSK